MAGIIGLAISAICFVVGFLIYNKDKNKIDYRELSTPYKKQNEFN